MRLSFSKLTATQKSGLAVGILGLVAAFAGSPYQGPVHTVDAQELARVVQTAADHVTVEDLADWIIQGKADYRLIDLRTEANLQSTIYPVLNVSRLRHSRTTDSKRTRRSSSILRAAFIPPRPGSFLTTQGYKGVTMLFGGLEAWKDNVLFPRPAENPTPAQSVQFAKMKEVSKFFGGTPQTDSNRCSNSPRVHDAEARDAAGRRGCPQHFTGQKEERRMLMPTIGFPAAMAALGWIDDLAATRPRRKRTQRT